EARVRPLADRRPVGNRGRTGARRGDGHLRRARSGAAALGAREAPLAREPPGRRLPVAGPPLEISDWRATVHDLAAECAEEWGLRIGGPYLPGAAGHVLRAELPDGTPAVLKLNWPHREAEQEADALERWDGDGAVRLYARDDERHALLLERCEPGSFLAASGDDRLGVLVELLPRLWKSGEGFRPLA